MNNQKIIIESLAMDLKRLALGLHRGSYMVANRFKEEALKRGEELKNQKPNDYLLNLLDKSRKAIEKHSDRTAEDALMYSTLFQNYCLKHFSGRL